MSIKEKISQFIADSAMAFCDDHLKVIDDGGTDVVEGEAEYEIDDYIVRFQVYRSAALDEYERKLKEKREQKNTKVTPYSMTAFWNSLYKKKFDMAYSAEPVPKDMKIFKNLMVEFDSPDRLKEMLKWYVDNYRQLPHHSAMPSLEGFYHYRRDVAFSMMNKPAEEEKTSLGVKFS